MTTSPVLYPDTDRQIDAPPVVRLLGRTEYDGRGLGVTATELRIFAMLAVRVRTNVKVEVFGTELWGNEERTRQTVQTHVQRLRKALPDGVIVTQPGGYMLLLPHRLDVDAYRFDHLVTQAWQELEAGSAKSAQDTLLAARSLWRGQPLEDVRTGLLLAGFAAGMEDRYRTAEDLRFEIELRLGNHRDVVDELFSAVRSDPTREPTAAKLMLALFRSHRQVEALQVFDRVRVALRDGHGLDPGSALRGLHAQILAGDRALELEAK